ncbi:hypothetical protein NQ314_001025, partial [Rhamnusium bicolor]
GLATILQKGLTVQEAIDVAFGEVDGINDSIEAVYIAPPDPGILTDEDSGDEDEGGDFDHLSKRQLLADAEVRTAGGISLGKYMPTEQSESKKMAFLRQIISIRHLLICYTQKFLTPRIGFREISHITRSNILRQIIHYLKTNQLLIYSKCK